MNSHSLQVLPLVFLLIGLLGFIFWLRMVIDAATKETDSTNKLVWVLIVFFLNILGALIYRFARKAPRDAAAKKGVSVS
jgi:cytochrome c oxidase assembly factor CtaG